jgi:hypothetical protein
VGRQIPAPPAFEDRIVVFSFKHMDFSNSKFTLEQCDDACDYGHKLLGRLKAIAAMKVNEFRFSGSESLRCHPISWEKTTEKKGFSILNDQLKANTPWQFAISVNQYGRVHGFFVENVFFIIWLDPKHLLYG